MDNGIDDLMINTLPIIIMIILLIIAWFMPVDLVIQALANNTTLWS